MHKTHCFSTAITDRRCGTLHNCRSWCRNDDYFDYFIYSQVLEMRDQLLYTAEWEQMHNDTTSNTHASSTSGLLVVQQQRALKMASGLQVEDLNSTYNSFRHFFFQDWNCFDSLSLASIHFLILCIISLIIFLVCLFQAYGFSCHLLFKPIFGVVLVSCLISN